MPAVYSFNRSYEEILEQLQSMFRDGGAVKQTWSVQAEGLVEPTGWDALWKLSKRFCGSFEVRFPCIACVTVTAVDFEELSATVEVLSVQHETVSLPERVEDVPLVELWPTLQQREQSIDVSTTAEFIDLMRFFFNNIWMPWDYQDDVPLLPATIDERMQLWRDLHNGTIPNCVARSIILLRTSAINAHDKLKDLDTSICGDDSADEDDSMLSPNYITQYAELTSKLDAHMAKWTLYERSLVRQQYLAKLIKQWHGNVKGKNVVALWRGGSIFEFEKISEFLKSKVNSDQTLTVTPSAENGLALDPEQLIVCNKQYELPEMPLANISICSFNGSTLKSSDMRSCLLHLNDDCSLEELTLWCARVSSVVVARGRTRIQRCTLLDDIDTKQSDFALGIVAMTGAEVVIEDTTFDSFYTAIVVHKGAQVIIRNCTIRNCGVGVQLYSGANVTLLNTTISHCTEHSIRCELTQPCKDLNSVEGLNITSNCKIGSGDLSKEVLLVCQDVDLV